MITVQQHRLYLAALAVAEALEQEAQCYLDITDPKSRVGLAAERPEGFRAAVRAHDAAKIELSAYRAAYREIAAKVATTESQLTHAAVDVADAFQAIHEGKDEGARFTQALARYRKLNGKD